MKKIFFLFLMAGSLFSAGCNAQPSAKANEKAGTSGDKIEAYYFHFTARCVTCRTVEAKAKENIETLYPDLVKQGKISFQSINLDEEANLPLARKLGVGGQTLLIVKGSTKIDLTPYGFMYAMHQPDKLKAIMKEKIDNLLVSN
ncbi:MAG TPA: nitrophenyl compound nitroreductase subunit ArsF family protein [Bacteroidales bacterium]|nr:nitrophenyl compound nitroreductase subunit ArsF family protein [Bacteroidales bacterium]